MVCGSSTDFDRNANFGQNWAIVALNDYMAIRCQSWAMFSEKEHNKDLFHKKVTYLLFTVNYSAILLLCTVP